MRLAVCNVMARTPKRKRTRWRTFSSSSPPIPSDWISGSIAKRLRDTRCPDPTPQSAPHPPSSPSTLTDINVLGLMMSDAESAASVFIAVPQHSPLCGAVPSHTACKRLARYAPYHRLCPNPPVWPLANTMLSITILFAAHQQHHNRLLRVQPIFCLVEHDAARPVNDVRGNLLAAVRGQAVQKNVRPACRARSAFRIHLKAL